MTAASPPALRGVSLIELVFVVAVIAIMAGIAVPRYVNALHHYRASSAAHRIAVDLELARAKAKAESRRVTVVFDVANNEYSIPSVTSADKASGHLIVNLGEPPYHATLKTASFDGDAQIEFDGFGAPDSGGTAMVEAGDFAVTVAVDAETGKADVQ